MPQIGRVAVAVLAGVVMSAAAAQDAVQWRVEDGGNGHWYVHDVFEMPAGTPLCGLGWAIDYAAALGCYPVTLTSADEEAFVLDVLPYFNGTYSTATIGLSRQDSSSPWVWVTGEEFGYSNFIGGVSDGLLAGLYDEESIFGPGWRRGADCFVVEDITIAEGMSLILEWSADCNGDGIVDYGQILDGTFADENGNGVPDCCEGDCPGDLNGDDVVGPPDLGVLLALWGTDGGKIDGADLNSDGTVNAADLGLLIGAWGDCGGCN